MKKLNSLSDLLLDYRTIFNLTQTELAARLDVDVRTIKRWENSQTLIKPEKEKDFVEILNIPYQVIRNLNSENPISLYYDIKRRQYSLNATMMRPESASWYNTKLPVEDANIHYISKDTDVEFVNDIQQMHNNLKPIRPEILREAAKILPEINLVLHDQSGYYAGHITVFPLKYDSYLKIRNKETNEGSLGLSDIDSQFTGKPLVFYFYSIYADSMAHGYYLVKRLLSYFKEKKFRFYLFAGITYHQTKVEYLREMGLRMIWEDQNEGNEQGKYALMEGDLDMFLFGKMN